MAAVRLSAVVNGITRPCEVVRPERLSAEARLLAEVVNGGFKIAIAFYQGFFAFQHAGISFSRSSFTI